MKTSEARYEITIGILHGKRSHKTRHYRIIDSLKIGRHASDLQLQDRSISRTHAIFDVNGDGRLTLRDCRSRNGTFVNGKPVTKSEISAGDVIQLGKVILFVMQLRSLPEAERLPAKPAEAAGREPSAPGGKDGWLVSGWWPPRINGLA